MIKKIISFFVILWIANRVQDEIQPNRLNMKWGIPYIGKSYALDMQDIGGKE